MPESTQFATESVVTARRMIHPCLVPFALWSIYSVLPIVAVVATGTPAWALLSIPPLAWVTLLGGALARGIPWSEPVQTERLDKILIDVGGEDAFAVAVSDQVDQPIILRLRSRPMILAATSFIRPLGDDVLRGLAGLQHAALRGKKHPGDSYALVQVTRFVVVFSVATAAIQLGNQNAIAVTALATLGFSLWLVGALYTGSVAYRRRPAWYSEIDSNAAQIAGGRDRVADALEAMDAWRDAARKGRSPVARIAHRVTVPVGANFHWRERAAALRSQR